MKDFKLIKWNSAVNGIVFILLGLLLLLFPEQSLNIGGYLIASILMLAGIGYIIGIIKNKGIETNGDGINLILSIAAVALSITIFTDPTWIIRMINIFVGIILIMTSTMNLIELLKFKKDRTTSWWILTSLVTIVLILGIVVIINPLFLAKLIIRIEGISLIIDTLLTVLLKRKVNKRMQIETTSIVETE